MATHYIFIDGKTAAKDLGINSRYTFAGDTILVYRYGRVVYCEEAHKGDAFVAMCEKGKVIVKKLVPPHRKGSLVAWLLNYQRHNRGDSEDEYEIKLAKYRQRYDWCDYEEWEYRSSGYVFTRCNSSHSDEIKNVAAFFSDAITKEEVLQLIPMMNYHPEWYAQKILLERFGITEKEFNKARKNKF